jgi:hypothetical protein
MDTYTQVGKVEDVSDEISMISPTNTPFLTMAGTEAVFNTLYQWQEDTLDAPATNANAEGATAPAAAMHPTVMRNNTTQIFMKTVTTTGSADRMKLHGAGVEFARQLAKKGKEIKRDLEFALVGATTALVSGSSGVARKFASAPSQFDASMVNTLGTAGPITEALILTASQNAYIQGGDPNTMLIKPSDSLIVANFAAATGRVRQYDNNERKVVNVVDVYVSPFGDLKVVMDRWQETSIAFVYDPAMWKVCPFRAWQTKPLAITGDFHSSLLVGEYGLMHKNYFADSLIANLT